jgi:sulfur carrier protein
MKIQVNGRAEEVQGPLTIKSLLETKKINPNVVACELNLKIIRRAQLDNVNLNEGDVLEIIQMIGGG